MILKVQFDMDGIDGFLKPAFSIIKDNASTDGAYPTFMHGGVMRFSDNDVKALWTDKRCLLVMTRNYDKSKKFDITADVVGEMPDFISTKGIFVSKDSCANVLKALSSIKGKEKSVTMTVSTVDESIEFLIQNVYINNVTSDGKTKNATISQVVSQRMIDTNLPNFEGILPKVIDANRRGAITGVFMPYLARMTKPFGDATFAIWTQDSKEFYATETKNGWVKPNGEKLVDENKDKNGFTILYHPKGLASANMSLVGTEVMIVIAPNIGMNGGWFTRGMFEEPADLVPIEVSAPDEPKQEEPDPEEEEADGDVDVPFDEDENEDEPVGNEADQTEEDSFEGQLAKIQVAVDSGAMTPKEAFAARMKIKLAQLKQARAA